MKEMWKTIDGYNGHYKISNHGRVKSFKRYKKGSILGGGVGSHGYRVVGLCKNAIPKTITVHSLVAKAFIPNHYNKPEINHKDGNKLNNRQSNLEWCTRSENSIHAFSNGLTKSSRGERSNQSGLTEQDVLDIRNTYRLGCFTQKEIGYAYGITGRSISDIVNYKSWSHE